ncbi:site-2 protease family protein [Evansella sp. AB-rgal1]|uniref:site-2 protease family protein n=1 Tax=Evansella sp. AB-rgal1 TaxID=3242696 RepID=UPI00359E39B8
MSKKIMKKHLSTVISMLIGAIIGFSIVIGYNEISIPPQYTALPFYGIIFISIFTYVFVIGIHELGHAVSFKRNGINVRAVIVLMFVFIKEQGKWKWKINSSNVASIGGIAVPDLESVKDEAHFLRLQKAYAKAILAGPLTTAISWILLSIISIAFMVSLSNMYIQSGLFIFVLLLTVFSLFTIGTSFMKTEIAFGDFPAYKLSKNDRFFMAMTLYQYAIFASDSERVRNGNTYLQELLLDELSNRLKDENDQLFTVGIVDSFVTEYLTGRIQYLPPIVAEYTHFLLANDSRRKKIRNSELTLPSYFHMLRFIYRNKETRETAKDLFHEVKNELTLMTPMRNYLVKQGDHVFGLEDNSEFLSKRENINASPAHGLWKNFEGYYTDEILLNEIEENKESAS